jgi:glutamine synthetase
MTEQERAATGVQPLPRSLGEALANLAATREAAGWFGARFLDVYLQFKYSELRALEGLDAAAVCARYAEAY